MRYWLLGGQRARSRSANLEAQSNFRRHSNTWNCYRRRRNAGRLGAGDSAGARPLFHRLRGYSADDTRRSFERACTLSAQLGEPQKEIQALFGLWGHYWMRPARSGDRARETLLARAELLRDPVAVIVGHRAVGSTLFTRGDFVLAREHLERAISLRAPAATDRSSCRYSAFAVDPRIAAQLMLAWDLWILGYPQQAHDTSSRLGCAGDRTRRSVQRRLRLLRDICGALAARRTSRLPRACRSEPGTVQASIGSTSTRSIPGSDGVVRSRRWGNGSRRCPRFGRESRRRPEATWDTCAVSCSDGWLTVQAGTGRPGHRAVDDRRSLRYVNDVTGHAWEAELRRLRGDTC